MTARADELRAAFDAAFAAAEPGPRAAEAAFVLVRVAGEERALDLAQIAALHLDLPIAPLPARAPALIGVATVKNAIVPVRDLGVALGMRATAAGARWVAIARGEPACGWAFDGLDGQALGAPDRPLIDLEELRHGA